jgi:hypothetical protein
MDDAGVEQSENLDAGSDYAGVEGLGPFLLQIIVVVPAYM